jgi:hypothetical protein
LLKLCDHEKTGIAQRSREMTKRHECRQSAEAGRSQNTDGFFITPNDRGVVEMEIYMKRDPDPFSLSQSRVRVEITYCPFCGEKLQLIPATAPKEAPTTTT